jgi:hypothetical protein
MMDAFMLWTRTTLLCVCVVVIASGTWFYFRQQRGTMGGSISRAKAAWLTFAILYWLGVCPVLWAEPSIPDPYRTTFGLFAVNFWLRGVAEIYMLYVAKNWRPPYGVGHDLFSIALVITCLFVVPASAPLTTPWALMCAAAVAALLLSLCAETYYALEFFKLVAGQTTGEEGIWFADQEAPKFKRINLITACINVPLYAFLTVLVAAAWGVFA